MRKQDETMKVIYYSWEESIQDLHELVRQMSIDRFRPQVIVGISRGGLPPAVMLSAYSVSYTHLTLPTNREV